MNIWLRKKGRICSATGHNLQILRPRRLGSPHPHRTEHQAKDRKHRETAEGLGYKYL